MCGQNYTVEERVGDASTGAFISRAVGFLGHRSTTTNSSGVYRFSNVHDLTYTLNASADSYVSNSKTLHVTGNIKKGTEVDIILTRMLESGKHL